MTITNRTIRWICNGCGLNNPGRNSDCDHCGGTTGKRVITITRITPLKVIEMTGKNTKEYSRAVSIK